MRIGYTFLVIISFTILGCKVSQSNNSTDAKLYTVKGDIQVTSDYCGGAHPSEEMLNRLKTPKPYAGKKIYIRAGNKNNFDHPVLYSLETDTAGKYSMQLPPGEYCIIDEYRLTPGFADSLITGKVSNLKVNDANCIQEWKNSWLAQFTVGSNDITNLRIWIHQECFRPDGIPCLMYTGQLPK